jgi:hypothetical protein
MDADDLIYELDRYANESTRPPADTLRGLREIESRVTEHIEALVAQGVKEEE